MTTERVPWKMEWTIAHAMLRATAYRQDNVDVPVGDILAEGITEDDLKSMVADEAGEASFDLACIMARAAIRALMEPKAEDKPALSIARDIAAEKLGHVKEAVAAKKKS